MDPDAIKLLMIRRTIHEHLEKEKRLAPLGIKVLSLFFIDAVEHYRSYDADGNTAKGKYATIFEEEYRRAAKLPEFASLFKEVDVTSDAVEVHDGYFSIDKNKRWTDTADNNQANRDNAERAYNLIMKDKEKLLSFDSKRRCCTTLTVEDSHCESMRLDRAHEQAITHPLPHDELAQLHCFAAQARVAADLAGQGDDLARAA